MNPLRVLLVDNDKPTLETMGVILEMNGFRVAAANDGARALEILEAGRGEGRALELMVLDLEPDSLAGIALLEEMKRRGHHLPVMVVTAFASKKTLVELLRLGVVDYLDKPVRVEEFRMRIAGMARGLGRANALPGRPGMEAPPPRLQNPVRSAPMDISELGLPNHTRRLIVSSEGRSLALARRKSHGYDLLVAEMAAGDAEAFYNTILLKTHFEEYWGDAADGPAFMGHLNRALWNGALKSCRVGAMFIRIFLWDRKLEILSAGHPPLILLRSGSLSPLSIHGEGRPLGVSQELRSEPVTLSVASGDRAFLFTEGFKTAAGGPDPADEEGALGPDGLEALILAHGRENLDGMVDNIWREILVRNRGGVKHDLFFWGLEIP